MPDIETIVLAAPIKIELTGAQGPAGTITVGTVTTGAPGSDVEVVNAGTASAAILNFTIPGADDYVLPTATDTVLGGVKIGAGVTITAGVISVSTDYAATSHTHDPQDLVPDPFNLVVEGDSIAKSLVTSLSGKSYFSGNATVYDVATVGDTISGLIISYASEVYPKRPAANSGKRAVLLVLVGTNDSTVDATIATNVSALLGYVATAQADGFEVWVCTLLARGAAGSINQWDGFNRRLKSSNVPDKIIDLNALFRDATDTALFADNLHPTATAIDIITSEINKVAYESDSFAPSNLGTMAKQNADNVLFSGGGGTLSELVTFSKATAYGNAKVNGGNDVSWAAESNGANSGAYFGSFGSEGLFGIKSYQGAAMVNALVFKATSTMYACFNGTPHVAAQLKVDSTTKGFAAPRMTTAQKNAIGSPFAGLEVFDTDLGRLCVYTTAWETIPTTTGTDTLTNKALTNPTVNNYVEGVVSIGTVTSSHTLDLTSGTRQRVRLTASTACTFTMPTATDGKSFTLEVEQAATTGAGTAVFTGVDWGGNGAYAATATAGKMDVVTFLANGSKWYGSFNKGYTY